MGRVFLGIAFSILLLLMADEWKTNDMSVSSLLSAVQIHGQTDYSYKN